MHLGRLVAPVVLKIGVEISSQMIATWTFFL